MKESHKSKASNILAWFLAFLSIASMTISLVTINAERAAAQSQQTRQELSGYEIKLQSRSFTPKAGVPKDLALRIRRLMAKTDSLTKLKKQRAHILVQLQNPPKPSDIKRFDTQGLTLLDPLNKRAWYATVTSRGAGLLANLQGVRWAELVQYQDKLAKGVQPDTAPLPYHLRPDNRIAYSVLFHKDVTADEVLAFTQVMDIKLEDFDEKAFPVVRAVTVNVPRDSLRMLAGIDIVAWIEPGPAPDENFNLLNAQPLSNVDDVQLAPITLDGSGVTVGVWEFSAAIFAGHLDLTPRVIAQAGQTATLSDHAAHVAGTIGASGANIANAEGMAPQAILASWDHTNDTNEMTNAANSVGNPGQPTPIQISNHSYGRVIGWNNAGTAFTNNQNLFGLYNNLSVNFDNVVFQTGLIVAKAAGNDRNDVPAVAVAGQPGDCLQGGFGVAADCIGPRGTAKNVITVGAMNGAGAIAPFSGFGPTDDGRIKPDLMAQGVNMLSLASNTQFTDLNGDGIDDVPNTNTANTTMSGTSMATPVVAGVAALVLQEANTQNIAMIPAAMKALLIQTAQDVQGIGQSNPGPDYATGWGIVDAEAAINLMRQSGLTQATLNATGIANAWTKSFYVPPGQTEVHITLVWDDPAGTPGGRILINDLDLRLIAPDATQFSPWILNPANPGLPAVRNGGNDTANNVEQVSVLNPLPGKWTAQVSANPGNLLQAPQDFAVAGLPFGLPEWNYEYAAKIICGEQNESQNMRLAKGLYATTINIHNPNPGTALFFKKLALTYPPEQQQPGVILPIAVDTLIHDQALKVDCMDIEEQLFPNGFPASYIEGFVIIQSLASLDVSTVHTTAKPTRFLFWSSHKVTSIDVEQVREREIDDGETEVIVIYDDHPIPASTGISTGVYTNVDGYRYVNVVTEFEQTAADEDPVSLGIMFAHNASGKLAARRYFNFEENFSLPADPQMITLSGKNSWHGHPHDKSSYVARIPVMGPFVQVFPFNHHDAGRKISIVLYLLK